MGEDNARDRALLSLYAERQLNEGEIRQRTGWSHWDFLDALGRHPDLTPVDEAYFEALSAAKHD
jgi:hypothetical protein